LMAKIFLRVPTLLEVIFKGGSKLKIILLMLKRGKLTAMDISKMLKIPLATVYKHLRELEDVGLIKSESINGKKVFAIGDFTLKVEWRSNGEDITFTISPKNMTVFLAVDKPETSYFISRRGLEKFLKFAELYEDYVDGKVTVSMIAKIIGVTAMEVAALISEVEEVAEI